MTPTIKANVLPKTPGQYLHNRKPRKRCRNKFTVDHLTTISEMLSSHRSRFFDSRSSPLTPTICYPLGGWIPTQPHHIAKTGSSGLPIWMLSGFFIAFNQRYSSTSSLPRPAECFWLSVSSPFYWETLREASEPGAGEWAVFMPHTKGRIKTMTHNNALVSLLLILNATWLSLVHVLKSELLIHRLEPITIYVSMDGIVRKDTEVCRKFAVIWDSMAIMHGNST